jgi:hypothetical protein
LVKKLLSNQVKRIYGPWDAFTRASKFCQVEATVEAHLCDFWDDCEIECNSKEEWKNFSRLSLK